MSLIELLPSVQTLTRAEKIQLLQTLTADLAATEPSSSQPTTEVMVWSPFDSFEAAASLQRFIDEHNPQ
jgi:hypothetical protein